jgi:hypothetical protein
MSRCGPRPRRAASAARGPISCRTASQDPPGRGTGPAVPVSHSLGPPGCTCGRVGGKRPEWPFVAAGPCGDEVASDVGGVDWRRGYGFCDPAEGDVVDLSGQRGALEVPDCRVEIEAAELAASTSASRSSPSRPGPATITSTGVSRPVVAARLSASASGLRRLRSSPRAMAPPPTSRTVTPSGR